MLHAYLTKNHLLLLLILVRVHVRYPVRIIDGLFLLYMIASLVHFS